MVHFLYCLWVKVEECVGIPGLFCPWLTEKLVQMAATSCKPGADGGSWSRVQTAPRTNEVFIWEVGSSSAPDSAPDSHLSERPTFFYSDAISTNKMKFVGNFFLWLWFKSIFGPSESPFLQSLLLSKAVLHDHLTDSSRNTCLVFDFNSLASTSSSLLISEMNLCFLFWRLT